MVWTAFIILLLLSPGGKMNEMDSKFPWTLPAGADKLGHGLLFFFEARFLFQSFHHLRPGRTRLAAAVGAAVVLGALTEIAQLFVPMRNGDIADFLADTAGAVAGGLWVMRPASRARGEHNESH
ncbi:MAG: VanZ family protein [Acidobacteriota bacterium]